MQSRGPSLGRATGSALGHGEVMHFNQMVYWDVLHFGDRILSHCIDVATCWCSLALIPSDEVACLLDCIMRQWITRHGAMRTLVLKPDSTVCARDVRLFLPQHAIRTVRSDKCEHTASVQMHQEAVLRLCRSVGTECVEQGLRASQALVAYECAYAKNVLMSRDGSLDAPKEGPIVDELGGIECMSRVHQTMIVSTQASLRKRASSMEQEERAAFATMSKNDVFRHSDHVEESQDNTPTTRTDTTFAAAAREVESSVLIDTDYGHDTHHAPDSHESAPLAAPQRHDGHDQAVAFFDLGEGFSPTDTHTGSCLDRPL